MQACLQITEIQRAVFEFLLPEHPATLARLARTCTAFTACALDALWRDQYWLAPLIQVMPHDLWKWELCDGIRVLRFIRPLEAGDWQRFDFYAPKIRRLGYYNRHLPIHRSPATHKSILVYLSSYRPIHALLENLRALSFESLDLSGPMLKSVPFFPVLLGPSVTAIYIRVSNEAVVVDHLPALFLSIARLCPGLHVLEVNLRGPPLARHLPPAFSLAFQSLIAALKDLRSISLLGRLPAMTPDLIHLIGSLTSLRSCRKITIPSDATSPVVRDFFAALGGRFRMLRCFEFEAHSLDTAAEITETLQCPLEVLTVIVQETGEHLHSSLTRFTQSFIHHPADWASSLTTLRIHGPVSDSGGVALNTQKICNAFEALFSLKALRTLGISWLYTYHLDDDWFAAAATSWPHLEAITFHFHSSFPNVTLAGLIPLVKNCPQLTDLSLAVSAIPFSLELLQPGICNTLITSIDFFQLCPIENPVAVFRCLVVMFPNLRSVAGGGFDSATNRAWDRVCGLFEESNLIRNIGARSDDTIDVVEYF
ncbi:hypothetical protein FPV67DRAFT_1544554 [Lyophyllum atratum]|nr:hypothetical protein FPV67DRAFT_1544554 [Lyophyllum atratum]